LRYAIAFALGRARKVVRGLKEGPSERERYAMADHAVAQLKESRDPWLALSARTARSFVAAAKRVGLDVNWVSPALLAF
jgi:hypothetical protein